ncbi:MAG: molybdate ABC transporter substrate-binding protein [Anaerolineae bacterium UTCFX2]|jgi:molybdate transport system substrate-binding protein|nr:molybdate ABC transporter substrate-binding protein [Anaerolineales bacterium]OQY90368.1 MAG: molybdate ABC transporter substrate-binding protein [Anaerolineae bacterium UTCFX2]
MPTNLCLRILIAAILLTSCVSQPAVTQVNAQPTNETASAPLPTETSTEAPTSKSLTPTDLTVFAAASLTAAFGEIGTRFEAAHSGVTVVFNFAGSQQLAQQIKEGARADVFASANQIQMEALIAAGEVAGGAQQIFAMNRLVVIYPNDTPGRVMELKDLAKPGLKLVLAAKEVPVGQYSLDFLDKASAEPAFDTTFKAEALNNVVSYEDTVKAVLAKVALGEADAGIVYVSDISGADAGKVKWIDIPDALNVIAVYPIAPVVESQQPELAQAFISLVLSQAGQDILAKYNFIPMK